MSQDEELLDATGAAEAVRLLEATGDYRVLRRLAEVSKYDPPNDADKFVALYIDTETTGLDPRSDQIIEFAGVAFEYDVRGNIYRLLRTGAYLEDPGRPLPPQVTSITGLTDQDLAGHSLPEAEIERLVGDARLVIAHNAAFDRPFVERRLPALAELPWACSVADIPWQELGFGSSSMEFLAYRHGFFFDAHRALVDCRAGVQILASRDNGSGETGMALLREGALQNTVRIWAEDSPYDSKDALKDRGYRWNPAGRVWWVDVPEEEHDTELAWLREHVYKGKHVALPYFRITAQTRYSDRVPRSIPPDGERR